MCDEKFFIIAPYNFFFCQINRFQAGGSLTEHPGFFCRCLIFSSRVASMTAWILSDTLLDSLQTVQLWNHHDVDQTGIILPV
jgi:hypothetical protein